MSCDGVYGINPASSLLSRLGGVVTTAFSSLSSHDLYLVVGWLSHALRSGG